MLFYVFYKFLMSFYLFMFLLSKYKNMYFTHLQSNDRIIKILYEIIKILYEIIKILYEIILCKK